MVPDYVMGCKRILISDEFYSALNDPCYSLDNSGIVELSEQGIVTKETERQLDVIIFATGFDLSSNFNFLIEVSIRQIVFSYSFKHNPNFEMLKSGKEVKTFWGIFYPNVPNCASILGPMTGLGHNSIIFMIGKKKYQIGQKVTVEFRMPDTSGYKCDQNTIRRA